MFKDARFWVSAAGLGIAAWLLVPQVLGARPPRVRAENVPVMEYICRETKEVFRLPATGPVLTHPRNGRSTLVPAVFDARSKSWRQAPPSEVRQVAGMRRR